LLRGQPEESGGVPGGPLADAVEGLAGDEEVLDEDQQPNTVQDRRKSQPPVTLGLPGTQATRRP
jgi:hypothetical protein